MPSKRAASKKLVARDTGRPSASLSVSSRSTVAPAASSSASAVPLAGGLVGVAEQACRAARAPGRRALPRTGCAPRSDRRSACVARRRCRGPARRAARPPAPARRSPAHGVAVDAETRGQLSLRRQPVAVESRRGRWRCGSGRRSGATARCRCAAPLSLPRLGHHFSRPVTHARHGQALAIMI